uniref:Regulatory-associated protein of mTOR, putative n=1 Tax=Arundo donax TaxID=35708 RepID=A0A0A9GHR5_ARUDO
MMHRQSLCFCSGFVYASANSGKISLRLSYLVCNQMLQKLLSVYCQSLNLRSELLLFLHLGISWILDLHR